MKASLFVLVYFFLSVCSRAQLSTDKVTAEAHMASAGDWRLKNDSARANGEIRKGIVAYLKNNQIREAAEAWLTLENYYASFPGVGYGPRIAYYERALKLFNEAGVTDRAADTRHILADFYMESAAAWKLKNDSVRSNAQIRKGITLFLKNGRIREAAEAWLIMENYYVFFHGSGYGPRIAYYEQGLALFKRSRVTDRAAATLHSLGNFYQIEGQHFKALSKLRESLALYQSIHKKDLQLICALMATIHTKLGNYNEALKYGMIALRTAESVGDISLNFSNILNDIAITYLNIKKYKQSLFYFKKALQNAKRSKDANFIILLSSNVADALVLLNRPKESYALIKEIERTYRPAKISQRIALNVCCLKALIKLKQYKAAKKYADTLLNLESQTARDDENQAILPRTLASYFMAIKDYKQAQIYITKFEQYGIVKNNNNILIRSFKLQYGLDSARRDFASEIKHFKRYVELRDLIFDEAKTKQIAQLEIQYQTEKKDQDIRTKENNISSLKKQAQLQAMNIKQKDITQKLTVAGVVLLAMLLGLSYNRYRLKQRVNHQLQQQQSEINEKNKSLTNVITEKDNLLEEKEWLMKEIHHRVKNNLQIVISLLNTQSSFLKDEVAREAIRESQHRMQSISLIHQKLYQSDSLALVNMPSYISDLVQYLIGSLDMGSRIKFETAIADIELDVTKSVPLGLILNEAITNAVKYAFPAGAEGRIWIRLAEVGKGMYELSISDNGIGLTGEIDITKSKTLGMSLMRGLSKQLSGSFSVRDNAGITIVVGFSNLSS